MSSSNSAKVCCPKCHSEELFTCWDSVNATLHPELKQKVLSGEIFTFTCSSCGEKNDVFFPLLYHDMEKKMMIYLVQEENIQATIQMFTEDEMMSESLSSYTLRVCDDITVFLEKVNLLDKGYNDKVIEICKVYTMKYMKDTNPDVDCTEIFFDVSDEKGQYIFFLNGKAIGTISFDIEVYHQVNTVFEKYLIHNEDNVIDYRWAFSFINESIKD